MSYILDALKKAESERNPGSFPHAQAPLFTAPQHSASPLWRRPWTWIGLAAAAATLTLAWLAPWQTAPSVVASAPAPQRPAPQTADAPTQAIPAPAAPAVDATPPQEAPPPPAKQKVRPAAEKKSAKAAARPETRSAKEQQPVAPEVGNRVAALHELPEHIRNEIPALSISGYLYSGNKADRTVLINKRLMHEGDQVAPDLTLEKLTPSGMVLNYKGYRYRISY